MRAVADIQYVIWDKGIGSTVSIGTSAELDRNKTEVLRECFHAITQKLTDNQASSSYYSPAQFTPLRAN